VNKAQVAIITAALLLWAFATFSLGVQHGQLATQQPFRSPVESYLMEHYGVRSVEELIERYRQEAYAKVAAYAENTTAIPPEELDLTEYQYHYGDELAESIPVSNVSPLTLLFWPSTISSGLLLMALPIASMKKLNKNMRTALLLIIAFSVVGMMGFCTGTIYAQTQSGQTLIEPRSFTGTVDYVIFGEDIDGDGFADVVYMRDERGRVFSYQELADAITAAQEKAPCTIVIRGTFLIDETIIIKVSRVAIIGNSAKIVATKANMTIFLIQDGLADVVIQGLWVDGNDKAKYGILMEALDEDLHDIVIRSNDFSRCQYALVANNTSPDTLLLEHLFISQNRFGGHLGKNTISIWLKDVHESILLANVIEDTDDIGLYMKGVQRIAVISGHFDDCRNYSVKIDGPSFGVIISSCYFDWAPDYGHIYLYDFVERCVITSNTFFHGGIHLVKASLNIVESNSVKWGAYGIFNDRSSKNIIAFNSIKNCSDIGIYITGTGSDENLIIGNKVYDSGTGIKIRWDAKDNYLLFNDCFDNTVDYDIHPDGIAYAKGNIGYTTENSGIAYGLADSAQIAHGLVAKPSLVLLTCLNATYDGVPVLVYWDEQATDATYIVVRIYWANGTAITDPVIAVSWYAEV